MTKITRSALAVLTFALAGLGAAAAQNPPPGYPPFPPAPTRGAPPSGDVTAPPPQSEPRADDPRFVEPTPPGGIARRPFFAPRDNEYTPRPPGAIGSPPAPAAATPAPASPAAVAALPPEDRPEPGEHQLPPQLQRQTVEYPSKEKPGTIIIDTPHTYLYLILGRGMAMRYGIGVGRAGFTWSGRERVSRMAEWPDWYPPEEMIARQPYLPRVMAGGPSNPLGARALYLGKTLYRIHGTNQPSTIGKFVSSGCIRMLNEDVIDLYQRVHVGTQVVVLPGQAPPQAAER
jgi:lipoprotein-anchoring transpeptidase ErfK/SrfK